MAAEDDDSNIVPFPDQSELAGPSRGDDGGGIGSAVVTTVLDDGTEVQVMPSGAVVMFAPSKISHNYDEDEFGQNLADRMDGIVLAQIANEVIEGVEADIATRAELLSQYQEGIDLLGTKLESVSTPSTASRSISRVGHPLLLESMIKYHAGAEAELCPAEGPAKIVTIGDVTQEENVLAQAFEADFNYYLTEEAEEFYPDTSAMLMQEAYCGNGYKKVYRCPMRERPVSEFVSMLDLIVSEDAKSLQMAQRVTHQFEMTRSDLRRMQIAGFYCDVDLGWSQATADGARAAVKENEGLSPNQQRPQDVPYLLWETDTDVDRSMHKIEGKWENTAPPGLPLPYKITVDKQTRQVLGIWRNWKEGDKQYRKRNMYVRYGLVPSLGFHHWGFLHILGNHTRALRAIWRLLIDSGMLSNFPGGIKNKNARFGTNEIAPNPGEYADADVPLSTDLRTILMPLPYKAIDAVFVQLATIIEQGAQRLGGAVMVETGEGKTNIPVGTMLAMIEQQTQVMAGVFKRNHKSQKDELRKLRELFSENPEDLKLLSRNSERTWENSISAFMDMNLVPASDPNAPSRIHRIMIAVALMTVAQQNPGIYDLREVNDRILQTLQIASPETLLTGASQPPPPPGPAGQNDPTKLLALKQKADLAAQSNQQKMAEQELKGQQSDRDHQMKLAEAQQDAIDQEKERQQDAQTAALESADRAADREGHLQVAKLKEQTDQLKLQVDAQKARDQIAKRNFGPDSL